MKEKRIAVFDTSNDDLIVTAQAVREYFDRHGDNARVLDFTSAYDFIRDFRDNFCDMAFLGINGMLDVETARSVSQLDRRCPLFFVSSVGDYGLEGLRLKVADYLIKPVTYQRVSEAISRGFR